MRKFQEIVFGLVAGVLIGLAIFIFFFQSTPIIQPDFELIGLPAKGGGVIPGDSVEMHPALQNTGKSDIYAIMLVTIHESNGLPIYLYDVNPSWEFKKELISDGLINRYYIYSSILPAGETTEPLLDAMTVSTKIRYPDIENKDLKISFDPYAVSAIYASPEEAWQASGLIPFDGVVLEVPPT